MLTDFTTLLTSRYSGRRFDPDKPVPHALVRSILEAGQLAPSCYNEQPWRYIVCDRARDPQAYDALLGGLVPQNQVWAKDAPVLMLAAATDLFTKTHKPNRWGVYDTGAASLAMDLQAVAIGLMMHQMGGFDGAALTQAFGLPPHALPMAVIALGYDLDAGKPRPPRVRYPLGHNFYAGAWGKAFE